MALSLTQDVTAEFNAGNGYVIDLSNWDYAIWQFVSPSGTVSVTATNDNGEPASSDPSTFSGNSLTATNFQTAVAQQLSQTTVTYVSAVAAAGLYRVDHVANFVKFGGASAAATRVLVHFHKIC